MFRFAILIVLLMPAAFAATAAEAFDKLRHLTGDWEAKTARGSVIRVSVRIIAAGTAVVETFTTASGRETLTIYHPDGANLIATHYCAQGNQPRLRFQPATGGVALRFAFQDATNLLESSRRADSRAAESSPGVTAPQGAPALPSAGASHLIRLELELKDADHFDKTEVYTEGGKDDTTVFHFVRTRAGDLRDPQR